LKVILNSLGWVISLLLGVQWWVCHLSASGHTCSAAFAM